ncbi:hypothetical protein Caferm_04645 [Corynebacterium afermentans subsp. afermentans]|uniref:hypothetical protein n=1 Tax=Corynebacterium afermentans TaxID=38286 RepID=UPI0007C40D56|nr:hypothetical protein [Corynebacterium afermentans]OAA17319.1 hypothetical protein Caferm_04645 [Corynebacterium afermentans subsp. afermentans]
MADNTSNWLHQITHDTTRNIADTIATTGGGSISHTTISRAASSDNPPAHIVVAVARAYGTHPVHALQLAGIITEEEAQPYAATTALRNVPSLVMLQELAHREAQRGQ